MAQTKKTAPVRSIADIIAAAKPRESTVTLCLAGDVAGRIEDLERELAAVSDWQSTSMADADPRLALAGQIGELQDQMRGSEVVFRFRALGDKAYSDMVAAHPPRSAKELFNPETLFPQLIAACCFEPLMGVEEYGQLAEVLNAGQRRELENAAWAVNDESTAVPFSLPASAIRAALGGGK